MKEFDEYVQFLKNDKATRTVASYTQEIEVFFKFFGIETIDDLKKLKQNDIDRYFTETLKIAKSKSKDAEKAKNTTNYKYRPVRAFFNWLVSRKYIAKTKNPCKGVTELKLGKRQVAFLTDEEIENIYSNCKNQAEKAIMAVLLTTGLRKSELINLRLDAIKDNHLTVIRKGNKEVSILLIPETMDILNKYVASRKSDKPELFITTHGDKYSQSGLQFKFKGICKRSGMDEKRLNNIHIHTTRHTFCTALIDANVNMRVVQELMSHERIETTMIYSHVRPSTMDNAMMNLSRKGV